MIPARAWPLVLVLLAEANLQGVPEWAPTLAAQTDAESAWRPDARSPYAEGLSQFTAATAQDIPRWCRGLDQFADWRVPAWQLRAQVCYVRLIADRYGGGDPLLAMVGYNAGPGWLRRERRLCPDADAVALTAPEAGCCARAAHACAETAGYIRRIKRLTPAYSSLDAVRSRSAR